MDLSFATEIDFSFVALICGFLLVVFLVWLVVIKARRAREERLLLEILRLFKTARVEGNKDPQSLVGWAQLSVISRRLFPSSFERLDQVTGGQFPFSDEFIDETHARWTSEWLSWEQRHDRDYKDRAFAIENQLKSVTDQERDLLLKRLDSVNSEKLQTYQSRYELYVKVGKSIAGLKSSNNSDSGI
tara:strand:+ start:2217 stop:2777 length:561 start_codon:yes stop_codon:yes gene_type:complete